MAQMNISNTLFNDTSTGEIAYVEQLKDRLLRTYIANNPNYSATDKGRIPADLKAEVGVFQEKLNEFFLDHWVDFQRFLLDEGVDPTVIDSWKEVQEFLEGLPDDETMWLKNKLTALDTAIAGIDQDGIGTFDVSAYNNEGGVYAQYADLAAALAGVPVASRRSGMVIRFIDSDTQQYEMWEYRKEYVNTTAGNTAFTTVGNWYGLQDTDAEPTAGSVKPVQSGGVNKSNNYNEAKCKDGIRLSFDNTATYPFKMVKGQTLLIISKGESAVNVSTRITENGQSENITYLTEGCGKYIHLDKDYNYLRVSQAADIIVWIIEEEFSNKNLSSIFEVGKTIITPDVGETVVPTYDTQSAYNCIMILVKANEVYKLTGTGANAARLYAITDTDKKVLLRSTANLTKEDCLIHISGDGYLIINVNNTTSYYFGKVLSYKGIETEILEINQSIENVSSDLTEISSDIDDIEKESEKNNGAAVVFAGAGDYSLPIKLGETYFIANLNSSSGVNTSTKVEGGTPQNVKTLDKNQARILTADSNYDYLRCGASATIFFKRISGDQLYSEENLSDGTISTPAVGSTLVPTINPNANFKCKIKKVSKGDYFYIKGTGGSSNSALYALTDNTYKVTDVASGAYSYDGYLYIQEDGYLVVNFYIVNSYDLQSSDIRIVQAPGLYNRTLSNDVEIGTLKSNLRNTELVVPANDVVKIYRSKVIIPKNTRIIYGNNNSVLLANDIEVSLDNPNFQAFVVLINRRDNSIVAQPPSSVIGEEYCVLFTVNKAYDKKCSLPSSMYNYGTSKKVGITDRDYFADFRTDEVMFDFSTDLNGMIFDTTIMEQLYSKFDDLMSRNSSYITKVDAATEVGLTYPVYANGVSSGDADYLETPAYKTYMYKLIDNNQFVNGTDSQRKKIFLAGGLHGDEIASPFNLYLLAKGLCDRTDNDFYMKLRATYDVYIIPCLNGYGIYHQTRVNANGVNLNRNFPVIGWSESGQGTTDYTGPTAGSEFETQLVIAQLNLLSPDVVIDHHNYGANIQTQFYNVGAHPSLGKPAYASLIDCSKAFIKNLPAYFGTKYKLFIDRENGSLPKSVASTGQLGIWAYQNISVCSFTEEICSQISYIGGVLTTDNPSYTNDVFKVAEYTLRTCITNYINAYHRNQLR